MIYKFVHTALTCDLAGILAVSILKRVQLHFSDSRYTVKTAGGKGTYGCSHERTHK